ncbi:MAG: hypothetical protein IJT21_04080 [Synergistaceae bacterium]|nr:hypothetical protein [Synergistaceae bacterium]
MKCNNAGWLACFIIEEISIYVWKLMTIIKLSCRVNFYIDSAKSAHKN